MKEILARSERGVSHYYPRRRVLTPCISRVRVREMETRGENRTPAPALVPTRLRSTRPPSGVERNRRRPMLLLLRAGLHTLKGGWWPPRQCPGTLAARLASCLSMAAKHDAHTTRSSLPLTHTCATPVLTSSHLAHDTDGHAHMQSSTRLLTCHIRSFLLKSRYRLDGLDAPFSTSSRAIGEEGHTGHHHHLVPGLIALWSVARRSSLSAAPSPRAPP